MNPRSKIVKDILVHLAMEDQLPTDLTSLDPSVFDQVFVGLIEPSSLKDDNMEGGTSGSHYRKDNKPLTGKDLLGILKRLPKHFLDKPVKVSGDEEGNTIGDLYTVEIDRSGVITLWPADMQVPD
jgi:hypothetical protein